jgi:hypothetical protein
MELLHTEQTALVHAILIRGGGREVEQPTPAKNKEIPETHGDRWRWRRSRRGGIQVGADEGCVWGSHKVSAPIEPIDLDASREINGIQN